MHTSPSNSTQHAPTPAPHAHPRDRTHAHPGMHGTDLPCQFEQLEERLLLSFTNALDASSIFHPRSDPFWDRPVFTMPQLQSSAWLPSPTAGGASAGVFASPGNNGQGLIRAGEFMADTRFAGIRGAGFTSVVIDTGINASHPSFGPDNNGDGIADRIVYQWNFATNTPGAADMNGHGSNVAGAIASADTSAPGVAPEAGIIALRVFDNNGSATLRSVESALRWVINNRDTYNIASVNLSLGDGGLYTQQTSNPLVSDELTTLANMGVIVVAAAGNSYYNFASQPGLNYPAADPSVISVGAVYGNSGGTYTYSGGAHGSAITGTITPFSQRSSWMDVFAPGAPITGPAATGAGTITMHGTSQASPIVAGAAVLIQQLAVNLLGRRLDLSEFRELLRTGSQAIWDGNNGPANDPVENDNVNPTEQAYRLLDLVRLGEALYAMAQPSGPATPVPNTPPTFGTASPLQGAMNGRGLVITYEQLINATGATDANGDELGLVISSVDNGRMTLNGRTVRPGITTLMPGNILVWTPAPGGIGERAAFKVTLTDSKDASSSTATIRIAVGNETRPIIPGVPDTPTDPAPPTVSQVHIATPMLGLEVLPGADTTSDSNNNTQPLRAPLTFLDTTGWTRTPSEQTTGVSSGLTARFVYGADQVMNALTAGLKRAA